MPTNIRPDDSFGPILHPVPTSPDPLSMLPMVQMPVPAWPPGTNNQWVPLPQNERNFINNVCVPIVGQENSNPPMGNVGLFNEINSVNQNRKDWNAIGRTQNPSAPPPADPRPITSFYSQQILTLYADALKKGQTVIVYDPNVTY